MWENSKLRRENPDAPEEIPSNLPVRNPNMSLTSELKIIGVIEMNAATATPITPSDIAFILSRTLYSFTRTNVTRRNIRQIGNNLVKVPRDIMAPEKKYIRSLRYITGNRANKGDIVSI